MTKFLVAAAAVVVIGFTASATAQNQGNSKQPANNWGQEVKGCNASDCYSGGQTRGEYVRNQARDDQGPGYGREIHDLASPGKSAPKSK